MTIGFRIQERRPEPDAALIARAAKLPVANIGDVMNRMQSLRGGFLAYGGRRAFAGAVLPVRTRAGDNLLMHRAIDLARPGEAILCDAGGDLSVAICGDLMIGHAEKRGVGALVIDGAVRDIDNLRKMDIGVWARGATPAGPYKEGPGEIGHPISCGGQVVMAGDLVAADEDGVVIVPREAAAEVIAAAEAHQAKEAEAARAIRDGSWPRGWVEETLAARGAVVTRG